MNVLGLEWTLKDQSNQCGPAPPPDLCDGYENAVGTYSDQQSRLWALVLLLGEKAFFSSQTWSSKKVIPASWTTILGPRKDSPSDDKLIQQGEQNKRLRESRFYWQHLYFRIHLNPGLIDDPASEVVWLSCLSPVFFISYSYYSVLPRKNAPGWVLA